MKKGYLVAHLSVHDKEGMQDPEITKLRTDAGVSLDTQELVFLVE
tara:strand:+ start:145 stop:279 length:135 start_codon:yes stop_codon:yes gene_type:complete